MFEFSVKLIWFFFQAYVQKSIYSTENMRKNNLYLLLCDKNKIVAPYQIKGIKSIAEKEKDFLKIALWYSKCNKKTFSLM